jgi:hypothetical protein
MTLQRWFQACRIPIRSSRRRPRSPRLSVEGLEERTVLSTMLVTNLYDHGAGSLRAALLAVNRDTANLTPDVIRFDLTGTAPYTIHLNSELPVITHPLFLDGTSQPGYAGTPIVRVDGTNIPGGGDGLTIKPWAGSAPFSAEIAGLALVHVVDGVQVLGTGSAAALTINLHDNVVKPVGGDGIQV